MIINERVKKYIMSAVWVAIALFVIRCLLSLNMLASDFSVYDILGYAGEAIAVATLFMAIYEKWIWRVNPLEKTPVLKKKYEGHLFSSFDGSEREACLEIKQTLLSIHVTLTTDESKSQSISASIDVVLGETQLTWCYLNTPKTEYRDRSEIHFGTAMMCIDNIQDISGAYYTDRRTRGDMKFSAKEE